MCIRIQRKRTKGFKMPQGSKYVGRPTKFGNPFRLTKDGYIQCISIHRKVFDKWIIFSEDSGHTLKDILQLYDDWISGKMTQFEFLPLPPDISELAGFDLACFCPLNEPCHVDVLIKKNKNNAESNYYRSI